jgi:FkbM family methyltransferase
LRADFAARKRAPAPRTACCTARAGRADERGVDQLQIRSVSALARLWKPHYVFRPTQLVRRLRPARGPEPVVPTPWGLALQVALADKLGAGIARTGVHELAVSELMWRLAAGDELALDVGANIGYFTGLLAVRAGHVIALEPNPQLRRFIAGNIERWSLDGRIELDERAASSTSGTATLHLPAEYEGNYGTASIDGAGAVTHEVRTVRLDELIAGRRVGVLKIDVEGHELAALEGASEALAAGLVRDVVFEEHEPLPSAVSSLLEAAGYAISGIEEGITGPRLLPAPRVPRGWDAPTYLATRDPQRARALASAHRWACLRPRHAPRAQPASRTGGG